MSVKTADKSLLHLYPPFRDKLARVLSETHSALGEAWKVAEGLRTPERQLWLWAQGRTRSGQIVTWMKTPTWHGTGLAADCLPTAKGYRAPMSWWTAFRTIYQRHGLENPAWGNGDLGHVQLTDLALRQKALAWVRAGFKDPPAPDPDPAGVCVLIDGQPVVDADAYLEDGRAWVKLRPVTDGLDLVIAEVTGKGSNRTARIVDDRLDVSVPVVLKGGRAFAKAGDLPARVAWQGRTKTLVLGRRG